MKPETLQAWFDWDGSDSIVIPGRLDELLDYVKHLRAALQESARNHDGHGTLPGDAHAEIAATALHPEHEPGTEVSCGICQASNAGEHAYDQDSHLCLRCKRDEARCTTRMKWPQIQIVLVCFQFIEKDGA
jgi:hypothetical protein